VAVKSKATDEQVLAAYRTHRSVWKAARALGLCGQSVHERLVKLGANVPVRTITEDELELLRREYLIYRDAGKLADLAKRMGRTKPLLCRAARALGLTDRRHARRYCAVWKHLSVEAADVIWQDFKAARAGLGAYCRTKGYDDLGFSRCMKLHFADEYESVIEAKAPRQSLYRYGRQFEYRVRDELRGHGYVALRSPASKSPLDLMVVGHGQVLFVQCKRHGALPPGEWNELLDLAASCGATPILALMPASRGIAYFRLTGRKDGSKRRQPMEAWQPAGAAAGAAR